MAASSLGHKQPRNPHGLAGPSYRRCQSAGSIPGIGTQQLQAIKLQHKELIASQLRGQRIRYSQQRGPSTLGEAVSGHRRSQQGAGAKQTPQIRDLLQICASPQCLMVFKELQSFRGEVCPIPWTHHYPLPLVSIPRCPTISPPAALLAHPCFCNAQASVVSSPAPLPGSRRRRWPKR